MALTKVDGEGVGTLDSLNITESNNGATEGPSFELHRNSASPADNDVLGALLYTGKSSTGADKTYSSMNGFISNVANANASGGLIFNTRNSDTLAERMRVDSSGKLGIGTASPAHNLDVTQTGSTSARIGATGSSGDNDGTVIINNGGSGDAMLRFDYEGNTDRARIGVSSSGQQLEFYTAGNNERMRIDSSGVGIGTSASPDSSLHVASDAANFIARFYNDGNNVNREGIFVQTGTDDGSGTNVFFAAYDGDGSETGQLRSVSGTFQLTDTSDERLKQDIVDTTVSGLTSVNSMKVRDFAYKRNPTETIKAGFVAQELQTVFSSAVSYSESDDDKILSVSRERLVPVLVKAIQELSAKNDALEARITALEDA